MRRESFRTSDQFWTSDWDFPLNPEGVYGSGSSSSSPKPPYDSNAAGSSTVVAVATEAEEAVRRCFGASVAVVGRLTFRSGVGVEHVLDGVDLCGVDLPALEPRRLSFRQSGSGPEGLVDALERWVVNK